MLIEGQLFAEKYKLIKLLGRGGFSEVWLAEYDIAKILVAIKIYAPGAGLDENGIEMFTQEFSLVFDLNHTNLLRPTHFDTWERQPYLILPYCKNGSTFNKYISGNQHISEGEGWKMLHDVAAGLAYLHDKKPPLIHQDIKPDNILISDEGLYMITDFGISARVRSTIRNGMSQEQSGGTLAYMGPERFSSSPKPIMASDVWSLGAMMYELMTGMPPFGNHGGVLQKNGADIPIIEGDEYSQDFKDIIYRCLAKDTWGRPSASKIAEETYNKIHGITSSVTDFEKNQNEKDSNSQFQKSSSQNVTQANSVTKGIGDKNEKFLFPKKFGNLKEMLLRNKKIQYGFVGIVSLIVVITCILVCSGSDTKEEIIKEEESVYQIITINYDSLAQIRSIEGEQIASVADQFLLEHEEDKYDEQYEKVEDIYIKALNKTVEALANEDSLSSDVCLSINSQKDSLANKLFTIYEDFINTAAIISGDASLKYIERAEKIKPYIEQLITLKDAENDTEN